MPDSSQKIGLEQFVKKVGEDLLASTRMSSIRVDFTIYADKSGDIAKKNDKNCSRLEFSLVFNRQRPADGDHKSDS